MSIGIILPATAQNIPSYVPKDGLVGWWPFNGNANDESGNGNNGTVNGATLTTDRNGKANSAYDFDGTNNFIDVKHSISLIFSNSQSISIWIYQTNSNDGYFLNKGCESTNLQNVSFRMYNTNGDLNTTITVDNWTPYRGLTSFERSLKSKWYNYIYTYDGNKINLYEDGVLVSSSMQNGYIYNSIGEKLTFGCRQMEENNCINSAFFKGQLDDIAIYNRALTQEEITALFTSTPLCTNPSAVITPQGNPTFCQGGFVNLNASIGQNFTYDWYKDSQIINGANDVFYQANTSGIYTVKVMDGACNTRSNEVAVTVNPLPTSSIAPQGNTTFCQGGSVNLVANGGTSYQWSTGSSNNTIEVNKSGTYTVNAFNIFGCQATASQEVTVNTNPTVTLNSLNQFTLKTQSPIQLVGNPAGGSFSGDDLNGSMFIPVESKLGRHIITYSYTNSKGCNGMATGSTILVDSVGNVCNFNDTIRTTITDTVSILKIKVHLTTGVKANQLTSLSVYPNPTSDVLIIEVNDVQALSDYKYRILDVSGKEVYNALVKDLKTEISFKSIGSKGSYILHIVDGNGNSIKEHKIILE